MKIKLIAIGKTDTDWLKKGIIEYTSRLAHYTNFEFIEIPDIKNRSKFSISELKEAERSEFEKYFQADMILIALDEKGSELTSEGFAGFIGKKLLTGVKQIIFIIGGAYGISNKILESCHAKIALSQMTFSHQMVRLFFAEQLYRAFTIIKGEKYHHK